MVQENLIIESVINITAVGRQGALIQEANADAVLIHISGQRATALTSPVSIGNWNATDFVSTEFPLLTDITSIDADVYESYKTFAYLTDGYAYSVLDPDELPLYNPAAVHRLYYGVDTKRLYMNIADTWQFIGSPDVQQLENIPESWGGGDGIVEAVTSALFPAVGASDTLYIDTTANLMYRWSGTIYVPMGASTAIGEVAGTAYPGEKGAILATALNEHLADMDIHTTPEEKAKLNDINIRIPTPADITAWFTAIP